MNDDPSAMSNDEWRGEVCSILRKRGFGYLANEFGALPDELIVDWRDEWANDPHGAATEYIAEG